MEDNKQIDLIDFSSENDNLIFSLSSPPPADYELQSSDNQKDPNNYKMFEDMDGEKDVSQDNDTVPELAASEEPERTKKTGKCNLRKSLAWDSAFFTNAGVLEPDELSNIIQGTGKREKRFLPGIQEDVYLSSDSISTLESDNLTLESIDTELFEDIRASIQKSCKTVKYPSMETGKQAISSSSKLRVTSANLPKPVMKKTSGSQSIGIPKSQPKMNTGKTVTSQPPKSALRIRESTSSVPKPPKEIAKNTPTMPALTKRASLSDNNRVKIDNDKGKTVAGRGIQVSKAPIPSGPRRVLPLPSSAGPTTINKTQSTRSLKGVDSSSSSIRRKVITTPRNLNPPSSSLITKTPSRTVLKSASTLKNAKLSAQLMSSKMSSNISPASSIGEWSSASSSSSVTQRSNRSRTSIDSSSRRSLEIDTPSLDHRKAYSDDQLMDGQDHSGEKVKKSCTNSRSSSGKPSGLRMPSPKIGFFDGVKSVRTPNGNSSLPVGLPKSGGGRVLLSGLSNKKNEKEKVVEKEMEYSDSNNSGSQDDLISNFESQCKMDEKENVITEVQIQSKTVKTESVESLPVSEICGSRTPLKAVIDLTHMEGDGKQRVN